MTWISKEIQVCLLTFFATVLLCLKKIVVRKETGDVFMSWLKKNYHWVIAAVVFLELLFYGGSVNNFSSYHIIPITESLAITRTDFSLMTSLRAVVCAISVLLVGGFIRRFGYRRAVSAGLLLAAAAYLLVAFSNRYWMLILSGVLTGVPDGLCMTVSATILVNEWFRKHKGAVLGAATAATGMGSTVLGMVQSVAIEKVSWRLSIGVVVVALVSAALLVLLLVRNKPEDMGLRPFGDVTDEKRRKNMAPVGLPMSKLKKQPAFYLLAACALFSCISVLLVSYQIMPYLQDVGFTASQSSSMYGIMMFLLGFVKIGMGALSDRIGAKKVTLLVQGSCVAGVLMLLLLPKTYVPMLSALLVFSMAMPMTTIVFPLLSADLLGYLDQGKYIGVIMAMASTASVVSSPIANMVFDNTASYEPIFWGSVILSVVMLGLYGILFLLSSRMLKNYSDD